MSWFTFIASDFPIEDVENTHIKYYSVNEALEKGLSVPEIVLSSTSIDRNKPKVLLYIDDESNFGEITIKSFNKTEHENNITNLKFCSHLLWSYSESRAKNLIKYIQEHLEATDKIEIWNYWNGIIENKPTQKIYHKQLNQLIPEDFEKMSEYDYQCLVVTQN